MKKSKKFKTFMYFIILKIIILLNLESLMRIYFFEYKIL